MNFSFTVKAQDGMARLGQIMTKHGEIRTPAFMPVGTLGTVKAMLPESVRATGADILLGNTYHLMLRPTSERIARLGGLHRFMHWDRPILTDSGGYQVMSLSAIRKITEEGVLFSSHLDGKKHMLTPERSMEIQYQLGSDITMVLDECCPYPATFEEARKSMERSMRWALRSKEAFIAREGYGLFGIMQGGIYKDLRILSAEQLQNIGFNGYAIGGLAVGEGQNIMFEVLDYSTNLLPKEKPRYLMGVGKPSDILGAVLRGVDMFDCVLPTRSGRNGQAFTSRGTLNLRNAKFAEDDTPLDPNCDCPTCLHYSRAYLHHVVKAKEIIGSMLMTWHNLHFYQTLMQNIRHAIKENRLDSFAKSSLEKMNHLSLS